MNLKNKTLNDVCWSHDMLHKLFEQALVLLNFVFNGLMPKINICFYIAKKKILRHYRYASKLFSV